MFRDGIYNFLGCSSHGLNFQKLLLSHQLVSAALHGSSFHCAAIYNSDLVEYIILLPKRKIPPDISICLDS